MPNQKESNSIDALRKSGMMSDLTQLPFMKEEHEAWLKIVHHVEKITGSDFNDERFNPLAEAIRSWGDKLVVLRWENYHREGEDI